MVVETMEAAVIVTVFIRRLKAGRTFADFIEEWAAEEGFGVPTRVFNAQSLEDPRDVISIGFVAVTPDEVRQWLAGGSAAEEVRHDRIETVIESTTLREMYEVRTEHDFSASPQAVPLDSSASLLAALRAGPTTDS
jgi:hypothetical protein